MSDFRQRLPQRTRIRMAWWGFHLVTFLALILYALRA